MHCEEVQSRLPAYSSGELPTDVREAVQAHLDGCAACQAALARIDALAAVLASAQTPPVPAGFAARVMIRARSRRSAAVSAGWNPLRRWRLASARMRAAAAAVLLVGLGAGLLMGWTSGPAVVSPDRAETTSQADLLDTYQLEALGDAHEGSLADSYFALMSVDNGKGR